MIPDQKCVLANNDRLSIALGQKLECKSATDPHDATVTNMTLVLRPICPA